LLLGWQGRPLLAASSWTCWLKVFHVILRYKRNAKSRILDPLFHNFCKTGSKILVVS
jgi:hypothetical protein